VRYQGARFHDEERTAGASGGFWNALTLEEQHDLAGAATPSLYPRGTVLWEEGDLADHLVLIISGYVRVSVVRDGRERIIALRGPGDIIGERAALLLGRRSAGMVALDTVSTLRLTTPEFAAVLARHPRVVAVLEEELYKRMTEAGHLPADVLFPPDLVMTAPYVPAPLPASPELVGAHRPAGRTVGTGVTGTAGYYRIPAAGHYYAGAVHTGVQATGTPVAPEPPVERCRSWAGQMCSIVFADIAGFSAPHRNDEDRLAMRRVMYDLLRDAFGHSQVPWETCHREDRGDGALVIVPPELPTRLVVDPMLARLAAGLRRHNRRSSEATRIQLRIALHVGPVTHDNEGVAGSAVIHTARLLDAPVFKDWLAMTQSDLGVIASTFVYDNVIADAPGYVVPGTYQQVTCTVKESHLTGWMHLSGATGVPDAGSMDAIQPDIAPPGTVPPGTVPPGTIPPSAIPPSAIPPSAI
jgi:hypothetical protein